MKKDQAECVNLLSARVMLRWLDVSCYFSLCVYSNMQNQVLYRRDAGGFCSNYVEIINICVCFSIICRVTNYDSSSCTSIRASVVSPTPVIPCGWNCRIVFPFAVVVTILRVPVKCMSSAFSQPGPVGVNVVSKGTLVLVLRMLFPYLELDTYSRFLQSRQLQLMHQSMRADYSSLVCFP